MIAGSVVIGFLDAGEWSACFGESLLHLMLQDGLQGEGRCFRGGAYLREMASTGGLPEGRNQVVEAFLDATEAEWLWFVDTDMGFAPDTVERLVATADRRERPVVGGLAFGHRREGRTDLRAERYSIAPTMYQWVELPDGEVGFRALPDWEPDSVVQVGATGAACLLIHRTALEAVRARYGPAWFNLAEHPGGGPGGRARSFSEDLSFCIRLAAVGVPVHVDTAVKTTHHKGGVYLDEDTYRAGRALLETPGAAPAAAAEPAVA